MELCNHVYRDIGKELCPNCGERTREIDWKLVTAQHKQWIAEGKAVYGGWWSV